MVYEGLSFGAKTKNWLKIADISFKSATDICAFWTFLYDCIKIITCENFKVYSRRNKYVREGAVSRKICTFIQEGLCGIEC